MARKKIARKKVYDMTEKGSANISRANKRRWRGYAKMTLAQKRKALGQGREPKRVTR